VFVPKESTQIALVSEGKATSQKGTNGLAYLFGMPGRNIKVL